MPTKIAGLTISLQRRLMPQPCFLASLYPHK
nr:MAG TPA: hypothetical protein [Caudoviricetes sp.]